MTPSERARELGAILSLRVDGLGDPRAGWPALLELAAEHRLMAALWSALRELGLPELPDRLAGGRSPLALLAARYQTNAARLADLRRHLTDVTEVLASIGVDAMPIKGGHLLCAGVLRDPAARETIDLDVLVPPGRATGAAEALREFGYTTEPTPAEQEPTDHQLAPLAPPVGSGTVEIHLEPMMARRRLLITADEVRTRAVQHVGIGLLPDATTALTLLIGHAQLQEDGARMLKLPLRALHDIHQLDPAFVGDADWDEIARRFWRLGRGGRLALAGFAAAARSYVGVDLPVPSRGGATWLRAVEAALDRPRGASVYRELAYLPIALRDERMARLYGDARGAGIWRVRARHLFVGARRRVAHVWRSHEAGTVGTQGTRGR